jgi:hypothetical protein
MDGVPQEVEHMAHIAQRRAIRQGSEPISGVGTHFLQMGSRVSSCKPREKRNSEPIEPGIHEKIPRRKRTNIIFIN